MIDIHTHILPGLDDGAPTLQDAVAIVRMAAKAGTTELVATPHHDMRFTFNAARVEEKLRELRASVGPVPRIHSGCELHFTPEAIDDALQHPTKFTIGNGHYLLLEFSDAFIPKTASEILDLFLKAGMTPIIVHPERNPLLRKMEGQVSEWCQMGCLIQLTAESFTGRFGAGARHAAERFLLRGSAHFVASDAHNTGARGPVLSTARQQIADKFGADVSNSLFLTNPRAVVSNLILPTAAARSPLTFWQQLRAKLA